MEYCLRLQDLNLTKDIEEAPPINFRNFYWVGFTIIFMIVAISTDDPWFLTFMHVLFGLLWTGIDLFMGFVLGPILRVLSLSARRSVMIRLLPRTLFIMPVLSIVTGTTGWFLADKLGYFDLSVPELYWVIGALTILAVLTIQGLGYLLPTNYRVYLELRKSTPDVAKITRLMRLYFWIVGSQGILQIVMIAIMTRFGTGL